MLILEAILLCGLLLICAVWAVPVLASLAMIGVRAVRGVVMPKR